MITKRQYHCLISGLPNLSFDGEKPWTSPEEFREMLANDLHPDDYSQVELVFLKEDNINLSHYLSQGEEEPQRPGVFNSTDFREQEENFSAILPSDDILPPYMVNVMRENLEDEKKKKRLDIQNALSDGYFEHIMERGCSFLKEYTRFDYDLNNLVSFIKAGRHELNQDDFIRGMTEHATHLASNPGKSPSKDPEFEYFDEIVSISESRSFSDQELKYDKLRWRIIDDMIFFENFSIDSILGYLQQLLIADRWSKLRKESGEKRLREIITATVEEAENNDTDINK